MTSSTTSSENWEFTVDDIEFEEMEMDETLLMDLLEESNNEVEEAEDDRLGNVIRSLEAEIIIDPKMIMASCSKSEDLGTDDGQEECSSSDSSPTSYDVENFDWMNEMEMDSSVSTSPSDIDDESMGNINNWYVDMIEFGGLRDYGSELYYGVHHHEYLEQEDVYSSLWQQTY